MEEAKKLNLKELNVNASVLSMLYRHYKEFIVPIGAIVASIILIFLIVVPQARELLKNSEQLKKEEEKLSVLRENFRALSNMDEADLNLNLQTLSKVLPQGKDFIGVINTISYNSVRQQVAINDFSFQVGSLTQDLEEGLGFPFLNLTLAVSGSPQSVVKFIQELYKSYPLAEVTDIKTTSGQGTLKLSFYYKPFAKGMLEKDTAISPFSKEETELISTLSKWNDTSVSLLIPLAASLESIEATPSSSQTSPF